jgi:hypothetical protein
MNGDAKQAAAALAPSTPLALVCIGVWLVAAASASALGIWLAIGGAAVALGATVLRLDRPGSWRLLRPSPRLIVLGVAAGCAMAAVTYLVYPLLASKLPFVAADTTMLYAAFRAPAPLIAALALGPIILGEELVWRGVVQTALAQRYGAKVGVVLAALAYALAHAPLGSPVLVAVALLCGLTWSALRATTSSLLPPLLAHLLWDVLVLLWVPLDAR